MATQSFGKYLLSEMIGSGGMAEVYAAMHPDLGRKVAIKVILPQFAAESTFEERFRREARLVASLRHPHIVQIYDFDVVDKRHFMVMEYLEGGTLKERLRALAQRKSTMPLPDIAIFLDAMASALDYAHARGAVHRDIKPPNILYTTNHEPVLTDFGIAKLMEDAARLTATGGVVGSPVYMPPEQATAGEVDARSDQYALGVVLYEMATGRVPFQGGSAMAVMTQHLHSTPPAPRTLNGTLPPAIDAVLLKALAKQPDQRFASAGELAQAFRHAIEGRSFAAPTIKSQAEDATVVTSLSAANADERTLTVPGPAAPDATVIQEATVMQDATVTLDAKPRPQTAAAQEATVLVKTQPNQTVDRANDTTADKPSAASAPPQLAQSRAVNAEAAGEEPRPLARPAESAPALPPIPVPPIPVPPVPKATTQNFNVGGIQAGIVNQGGEQTFSGDLTFNLDFGDVKAAPPQPAAAAASTPNRSQSTEVDALIDALRRAFAASPRVDRFVRLVTQFYTQLEALPDESAGERKQVVKRAQALLLEMTEAKPDADMVGIMGASLERAVQPLAVVDPDLPTLATRITSWVELMVQPE